MSKARVIIGAAVAMAMAAPSFAFTDPTTAQVRFFVSGASAPTHMLREQIVQNICDGVQPVDVYVDAVNTLPGAGGKPVMNHTGQWVVQCIGAGTATGVAGQRILVAKSDVGGSGNGVTPVANGTTAINFLNTASAGCTAAAPTAYLAGDATTSFNLRICGTAAANLTAAVPDAGVSDVEPKMFVGDLAPIVSGTPANFVQPANWETAVGPGLVFGIAVSLSLRNELQTDQIAAGKLPGTCTAGNETAACQPDLPSWYIRSLFTGKINNWADEQVNGGTPDVPAGFNGRVHLCRRVQGSGTHAQHLIHYNRTNCQAGTLSMLPQPGGSPFAGDPFVYENSSAGNVGVCLDLLDRGVGDPASTGITPALTSNTKRAFAIGYQSLENNASNGKNYRFVKVDGVTPTVENAWNGTYGQVYFLSYNHRPSDFKANPMRGGVVPGAAETTAIEWLADNAFKINGSVAGQINEGFEYTFGRSGFLVNVADNLAPAAYLASNPAVPFARLSAGGSPDSCAPMYR